MIVHNHPRFMAALGRSQVNCEQASRLPQALKPMVKKAAVPHALTGKRPPKGQNGKDDDSIWVRDGVMTDRLQQYNKVNGQEQIKRFERPSLKQSARTGSDRTGSLHRTLWKIRRIRLRYLCYHSVKLNGIHQQIANTGVTRRILRPRRPGRLALSKREKFASSVPNRD